MIREEGDFKEVCLGQKLRGHGKGKINGIGGKIEDNETSKEAAVRETKEESGVNIRVTDLLKVGDITYLDPSGDWHSDVYLCKKWSGKMQDSKEMKLDWYSFQDIPYKKMWPDDKIWFRNVLSKESFKIVLTYDQSSRLINKKWET